jgi:hypothetical protein
MGQGLSRVEAFMMPPSLNVWCVADEPAVA